MGIPTSAPASFFSGDTVKWTVDAPDYLPADGWSLDVNLTSSTANASVTSSDNGDGLHLVTLDIATTTGLAAGDYALNIAATKAGERYTIFTGTVSVQPNIQSVADARSHVKKTLDALEAWIESRSPAVASYQIAGRQMQYWSAEDLIAFHDRYRKLYNQEQNAQRLANGQKPRRRLLTRMAG